MRKLGEELREVRELYEAEQDKTRSSEKEVLQLHNQVPTSVHVLRMCTPVKHKVPHREALLLTV